MSSPVHVAVLMGGWSSEREVSLVTGAGVADALERVGYRVTRIDMDRNIAVRLSDVKPDVVFNALHGTPGEDGTVQGMILSFDDIVASIGQKNIVELAAAGIKVALLTTCLGLIVGIPAFAAYNYFTGVINRFVLDVEETSTELIETVTLHTALSAKEHEEAAAR